MTTSSLIENREPVSFSKGKMYKCTAMEGDGLVILCVRESSAEEVCFEGVVIHPDSGKTYCIGTLLGSFKKRCFTDFHGQVVLKS